MQTVAAAERTHPVAQARRAAHILHRHPRLQRAGHPPRLPWSTCASGCALGCGQYEIILAENGSRDRTVEIGQELAGKYGDPVEGQVKMMSLGEPNYGKALKQGILLARGDIVLCDEIDLCDTQFHKRAVDILDTGEADLVIGSKLAQGSRR